jgi:hypothetical protein
MKKNLTKKKYLSVARHCEVDHLFCNVGTNHLPSSRKRERLGDQRRKNPRKEEGKWEMRLNGEREREREH